MGDHVFARSEKLTAGLTKGQIDNHVDQGRWMRLRSGVYASRRADDSMDERTHHLMLVAAAQICVKQYTVASMWSAALLHGLPVPRHREQCVSLTRRRGSPCGYPDLRIRVAHLPTSHIVTWEGVPMTSAARTVVDLARHLPRVDGVVIADSALHLGLTTPDELATVAEDCSRWPGIRAARTVLELADGRAESPLESRSRILLVHDFGLPVPLLNEVIRTDDGRPVARADMYWPRYRTIGEADGALKYHPNQPDALFREKLREDELRDLTLQVVRWTSPELDRAPARIVGRLRRAFARGLT